MNPKNGWLRANVKWHTSAVAAVAVLFVLAACSSGTPKNQKSAADAKDQKSDTTDWGNVKQEEAPPGAAVQCLDSEGNQVECSSNDDCCDGFECGIDPDGSARIKTCIWAGKDKR